MKIKKSKIEIFKTVKIHADSLKGYHKELIKNNELILKIQPRFRSEKHHVFTEEINKIALGFKWR